MQEYQVILRDSDGCEIDRTTAMGMKEAKTTAKYWGTEEWASRSETTHETLRSDRIEILDESGDCVWDMPIAAHSKA